MEKHNFSSLPCHCWKALSKPTSDSSRKLSFTGRWAASPLRSVKNLKSKFLFSSTTDQQKPMSAMFLRLACCGFLHFYYAAPTDWNSSLLRRTSASTAPDGSPQWPARHQRPWPPGTFWKNGGEKNTQRIFFDLKAFFQGAWDFCFFVGV